METWEKWDRLLELANNDDVLHELYYYLSNDVIEEFIEYYADLHEIEQEEFENEDYV